MVAWSSGRPARNLLDSGLVKSCLFVWELPGTDSDISFGRLFRVQSGSNSWHLSTVGYLGRLLLIGASWQDLELHLH